MRRVARLMMTGILGGGGIRYLLRDLFSTDLAAGAINGTLATGGTGTTAQKTRSVVDAESKLTISGSALVCSGGKAVVAWSDPGLFYGAFTRAPGMVLCVNARSDDTIKDYMFGWAERQTGVIRSHAYQLVSNGRIALYDNNGGDVTSYPNSYTSYMEALFAIVLRADGASYLVRGGQMYQDWTLLKTTALNSIATLYPCVSGRDSPFSVYQLGVPERTVLAEMDAANYAVLDSFFKPYTTHNILGIGDSRTEFPGRWLPLLSRYSQGHAWLEKPARIATGGITVVATAAAIDAALATRTDVPEVIWIDLGINDYGVTSEADFKSNYLYIIDACHTKWPNARIFLDQVYKDILDTTAMNAWIAFIASERSSFVQLGTDERIYGPGNTTDGVHFTNYGYKLKADAILTVLGYPL
jgi:lysophospholipase L1-like esterase